MKLAKNKCISCEAGTLSLKEEKIKKFSNINFKHNLYKLIAYSFQSYLKKLYW